MPLFNRFRGAFSGIPVDVDPYADPHTWKLPSSYPISKPGGRQTTIPDPRIFGNAFTPTDAEAGNTETILTCPDISHAAVHLALLECFRNLRISASALDVEVPDLPAYTEKPTESPSVGTTRLPESQRWDLVIKLAISRFEVWWANIGHVLMHLTAYGHHAGDKVMVQLSKEYLPPLDVLLVWYVFMQDSDAYHAACISHEPRISRLEHLCFPWLAIRDVIDMERFHFTLPRTAQNLFSTLSGQSSDILTYLESPPAYTDDCTPPFKVDLFDEIKDHENIINEAHSLLWIRAPALAGSLTRASVEYSDHQRRGRADRRNSREVPFGIDLFWKTHRLFPSHYRLFIHDNENCGQSSESKASVPKGSSSDSAPGDSKVVSERCQCWTCERIRDDIPSFVHTTPSLDHASSSTNPSASARQQILELSSEQIRQIQDDVGFYQAVEKARTRREPLPTRPPTATEKEAEATAKAKQKELGYRPGSNEYLEILPDGTRKIRQRQVSGWGSWTTL
ncbi:hypothetical protein FSARC_324 [Fusarium sarcochroum]|uniref:Uncharacterized protein n=1 Tax=Fusarium sarcochroum TaxID=1208366 RepID=A0A8H4UBR7_9HYPO|nr:hypothetical protein FSARC_324 [Fusarium sarcochroum]